MIFLNRFFGDILLSSLVSFAFFLYSGFFFFFLLACVLFEIKNIYPDTHSTVWAGEQFSPGRFPEARLLFFGLILINLIVSKFSQTVD